MEVTKPKKQRKRTSSSRRRDPTAEARACVSTDIAEQNAAIDERDEKLTNGREHEVELREETVSQQDAKLSDSQPVTDTVGVEQKSGHSEAVQKDVTDNVDDVGVDSVVQFSHDSLLEHGNVEKTDVEEPTVHDRSSNETAENKVIEEIEILHTTPTDKVVDDGIVVRERSDETEEAGGHLGLSRTEPAILGSVAIIEDAEEDIAVVQLQPFQERLVEAVDERVSENQQAEETLIVPLESDLITVDEEEPVFTEEQLEALYENSELKVNKEFVDNFLKKSNQERHEFHELLMHYYKARLALVDANKNIKHLKSEYDCQKEKIWETEEFTAATSGKCADGSKVKHAHNYKQAKFNSDAAVVLNKVLKEMRSVLHEALCMKSYTCQLAKQHIDLYIYHLLTNLPFVKDLRVDSSVTAWPVHLVPPSAQMQLQQLQQCISVLFMFHRRRLADEEFVTHLRNWTMQLVSCLLRVATVSDHLFLLNHLLRCPPGVGQWGSALLQILPPTLSGPIYQQWCWSFEQTDELSSEVTHCLIPPQLESASHTLWSDASYQNILLDYSSWGGHLLDHLVTMLSTLLFPVKQRDEMLADLEVSLTPVPDGKCQSWTFVDEDGEEDDEPSESSLLLKEKDYIDFFNQFPLSSVFQYILGIQSVDSASDYSVERMSSFRLMRLFAFSNCLIKVLGAAFSTLQQLRYKRFIQIIGQSIRQVFQYMSDHWVAYRSWRMDVLGESEEQVPLAIGSEPAFSLTRLQCELDELSLRSVVCFLQVHHLGIWQFLADMPYHSISPRIVWKIFWMLIDPSDNSDCPTSGAHNWRERLNDPVRRDAFNSRLMEMSFSESTFLLTTFANMARSQPEHKEFVEGVCLEIYEISQMNSTVREFFGKTGRDLLGSVTTSCPHIISVLMARVSLTIDETGMEAVHLFKALPLQKWIPTDTDMQIVRSFLLQHSISSCQHHLARSVLAGLNWGLSDSDGYGELALPVSLHRVVAVILVEVELAVDLAAVRKLAGGDILAQWNVYKSGEDIKKVVNGWLWTVALSLHLHCSNQPAPTMRPTSTSERQDRQEAEQNLEVPNLDDNLDFLPVKQATPQSALACFIALSATLLGHNLEMFCSTGLQLLGQLVESKHWLAALKVLSNTVTTFITDADALLEERKFLSIVHSLALADLNMSSFLQKLTGRAGTGSNTKMLASLVQTQVLSSLRPDRQDSARQIVEFWTLAFTSFDNWSKEKSIQCVLDSLVKAVFHMPACLDVLFGVLYQKYEELLNVETKRKGGIVGSFFSAISSSNELPSLLDFAAPEYAWFAFAALSVESQHEKNCGLRDFLHSHLEDNPKKSVDQVLKAYFASHSFPKGSFRSSRLCIYRWGQLAESLEDSHPLLPVVWQRFFALFFYFPGPGDGSSSRYSQGLRFYSSLLQSGTLRTMKRRLLDVSEHHKSLVAIATAEQQVGAGPPPGISSISHHQNMEGVYYAMSLWLEEPRLHSASLYLPDLPAQYLHDRLDTLMKPEPALWYDLIDQAAVASDVHGMIEGWLKATRSQMEQSHVQLEHQSSSSSGDTAASRLISRLRKTESSPRPPPAFALPCPPLEMVSLNSIANPDTVVSALTPDLMVLVNYAKSFSQHTSTITELDFKYLDQLPTVYYNEECTLDLNVPCRSRFSANHTCTGPARLVIKFKKRRVRQAVSRRIDSNRETWLQVFKNLSKPLDQPVAESAIRIESAITLMAKAVVEGSEWRDSMMESASVLFYHMVRLVDQSVNNTPPIRQFFAFCVDELGQRFISKNPTKTKQLLFTMIDSPELSTLLCPIFMPNESPGDFTNMYERVAKTFSSNTSLSFSLLSKFDVHMWLTDSSPEDNECKCMINYIGGALAVCGREPSSDMAMMFGLYQAHLRHFLCHRFPSYYGDILQMLLTYTSQSLISPLCWEDFHSLIGCPILENESKSSENLPVMSDNYLAAVLQLSPGQVTETVEWLGGHFGELRKSLKSSAVQQSSSGLLPPSDLYSCLSPYITLLASLLGYMGQLEIIHTFRNALNRTEGDVVSDVQTVWQVVVKVFDPWIQILPVTMLDGSIGMQPPWSKDQTAMASRLVAQFSSCVSCLQLRCQAFVFTEHDAMSLVWQYYHLTVAQSFVPSQVLVVVHAQFRKLPWESFFPTIDVLRSMVEMESSSPSCFVFLSKVIPRIDWSAVINKYELELVAAVPEAPCLLHSTLLQVIIKMLVRKDVVGQDCPLKSLFPLLRDFHWYHVDARAYASVCLWQQEHCDPVMVMHSNSWLSVALGLLRHAAEFDALDGVSVGMDALAKRCRYIQLVVTLVSRCTSQKELVGDTFSVPLKAMFEAIETCVVKDGRIPSQDVAMMLSEFLSLLNHCPPGSVAMNAIRSTILQCIMSPSSSSSRSVLSLPFITASCHALASMSHMAAVLEAAITIHFRGLSSGEGMTGGHLSWLWSEVLTMLEIPELSVDEFLQACVSERSLLTLYAHTLKQLPQCTNLMQEFSIIGQIAQWCSSVQITADCESKIPLLWHKAIDLSLRQIDFGGSLSNVVSTLNKLAAGMVKFGEDKESSGFLGAIGLGKRSHLSTKFRFFSRSLAAALYIQLPSDLSLRLQPNDPGHPRENRLTLPTPQTEKAMAGLESLRNNKQYADLVGEVDTVCSALSNSLFCLRDIPPLISRLANTLFPTVAHLHVLSL